MRQYIQRGILGISLIVASAVFLGCRNESGLEKTLKNQAPTYSAIEKNNKPSIYLENTPALVDDKISQTLEDKCPKEAPQKIQEITYEKFKQEKLGKRYASLSESDKQFFDRVYGPRDWKLLNDIFNNPKGFIEELSKELNSSDYLIRYLKFRDAGMENLDKELVREIKNIAPIIDFNKPDEFDITTAFYFIELRRALYGEDLGIKK